ncbi:MAG: deoxyribonuclease IV [Gemmatimonadales bacterium]
MRPIAADASSPPIGAHVSTAGGIQLAPSRAGRLGADALQLFTKSPQQWAERVLTADVVLAFVHARREAGIVVAASHDSYLINLATPDRTLRDKSVRAFRAELERCEQLGLEFLVTHPGNATSGSRESALRQNAELIGQVVEQVPGRTRVLLETTAGSGSSLGCRFEEIALMIDGQPPEVRERLGVCLDTAHVFAAGYDLRGDYDAVVKSFDAVVGLDRLALIHCNDSLGALGSRRDRHTDIGAGQLGEGVFRDLMRDPRLGSVPRVLETPKGEDPIAADRRNLATLRRLAGS